MTKTQIATSETSVSSSALLTPRPTTLIKLKDLALSDANMRKSKSIEPDFVESIRVNGIVQALTVTTDNKVAAGRRRFNALTKLRTAGVIDDEYPVPCVIADEHEAAGLSIIENMHRLPPHPCEYFTAIVKLSKEPGSTKSDICTKLQIASLEYDKYIRLANLHQKIFKAYKDGILNIDQVQAFAATHRKKLQIEIWEKADFNPSISAYQIKRQIHGDITSDSAVAKFVGMDAYTKAGGKTTHDLFGDVHTIHNIDLIERLADDKLTAAIDEFKTSEPGWKWYDIVRVSDDSDHVMNTRHPAKYRKVTTEQKKALNIHDAEIDKLEKLDYEDLTPEQDQRLDALYELRSEVEERVNLEREFYAKKDMKSSGVLAKFSESGVLVFDKGVLTKDDVSEIKSKAKKAAAKKSIIDGDNPSQNEDMLKAEDKGLSQALTSDLNLLMRSFLKAELLAHPELAIEALNYSMIMSIFGDRWESYFNDVSANRTIDETSTNHYAESKCALILEKAHQALPLDWLEHDDPKTRFETYVALNDDDKRQLLTYVSTVTFQKDLADIVATKTDLQPRTYWSPSVLSYFGRVSKRITLDAIEEIFGPAKRNEKEILKKSDLAGYAESIFTDTKQNTLTSIKTWLPPIFRKS